MTHTPFVSNPCPATAIVFVFQNLFYGQLPQEPFFYISLELPVLHLPESGIHSRILYVFQTLLWPHPESTYPQEYQSQPLQELFPHELPLYVRSLNHHRRHSASCVPGIRLATLPHGSVLSESASLHHRHL